MLDTVLGVVFGTALEVVFLIQPAAVSTQLYLAQVSASDTGLSQP